MRKLFLCAVLLCALSAMGQQQIPPDCSSGFCAGIGSPMSPHIPCKAGNRYSQLDAPGTGWSCTGVPPDWVQDSGGSAFPGVQAYGDSITIGEGAVNCGVTSCGTTSVAIPASGYAQLLLSDYGGSGLNWGTGSDMASDLNFKIMSYDIPTVAHNLATTMMIGTNDYARYGTTAAFEQVYQSSVEASAVWAATPPTGKVIFPAATNGLCTVTGTWSTNTALIGSFALPFTTTNGDHISCQITTFGGPIYVAYLVTGTQAAANSAFTITVDGALQATLNTTITGLPDSVNGSVWTVNVTRIPGPYSAGTHTVLFTYTGQTAGVPSGIAVPAWIATSVPYGGVVAPPSVFVGGVPYQQNDAGEPASGIYNGLAQAAASTLAGDGFNVTFVDVRSFMNTTTDFAGGLVGNVNCPASPALPVHPGNCGHAHIAQAFEAALKPDLSGANSATAQTTRILVMNAPPPTGCNFSAPFYFNQNGTTGSLFYICKPNLASNGPVGTWTDVF